MIDEKRFIQHIHKQPYICTIPAGGLRAIRCYPDAKICFIRGVKIGYSAREKTMIVPLNASWEQVKICKEILLEHLHIDQNNKIVLGAVNKEKQNKR